MASRFPSIATSRRRRVLAASLNSPAVRARRASASLRRVTGAWHSIEGPGAVRYDGAVRGGAEVPEPLPAIISRR